MQGRPPVFVLNANTRREEGRKTQIANIQAAQAVADIVRTCLGPQAMLKMVLDPMGGIVMTNDGNAILREIDVTHPAAKSMIDLSRAQDEEVGDGTTSVIVLAGEILQVAAPLLERNMHPKIIVQAFYNALDDALAIMEKISFSIDVGNREMMTKLVMSCLGTKFSTWMEHVGPLVCSMAIDAVQMVILEKDGRKEIDIKKYAKVEKVPGGEITDSKVIRGCMINKDISHSQMRRRIENPRVILLDCPLEYKKGESQTDVEITNPDDFATLLKLEEEYIANLCSAIIKHKPDVVITEKGLSDLAQHFFVKNNITALRRFRKTDNLRIARATGGVIVNRPEELTEEDVGKECGLFEVRKIGDEYFTFFDECKNPKACTILLRGPSKDILNEIERNLQDAMQVARNVHFHPKLLPGGGAVEMEVSRVLSEKAKTVTGVMQWPYQAAAIALEVIPRTLAQNCGSNVIRVLTQLRAKHASGENECWGIDGNKGEIANMKELGIWEPFQVKAQTLKTSIEAACMLLRIDNVVSGMSKSKSGGGGEAAHEEAPPEMQE